MLIKTVTDKTNEIKIVPGPMNETIFFGIVLNPVPKIRNPSSGNNGINVTTNFIRQIYYLTLF